MIIFIKKNNQEKIKQFGFDYEKIKCIKAFSSENNSTKAQPREGK
jgi:hypothetical protein